MVLALGTPGRTMIKFCGCTSPADARSAIDAGADAVGVIFAPSPRRIDLERAKSIAEEVGDDARIVAVFVDPQPDDIAAARAAIPGLVVQFSGDEPPSLCAVASDAFIKVFHVEADATAGPDAHDVDRYGAPVVMFDTAFAQRGGSGRTFAWDVVAPLVAGRRAVISGGLTPHNVGQVVSRLHPYGVDVRSGIETGGVKDLEKMRAFVRAVRQAEIHAEA